MFGIRRYYLVLVLMLIGFGKGGVFAQEYLGSLTHYNVEDGLYHREVNSFFEDDDGYIWLATKSGINRFDGHQFLVWTKEKDGLLSNHINDMVKDAFGNIWLVPLRYKGGNLSAINYKTGEVTSLSAEYGDHFPFPFENINERIIGTSSGELIFGNREKSEFVRIDTSGKLWTYELPYKFFNPVSLTDHNTLIGIVEERKIVEVDLFGKVISQTDFHQDLFIYNLVADGKGVVYAFNTPETVTSIDKEGIKKHIPPGVYPLPNNWFGRMKELISFDEKKKTFWVCNEGDTHVYSKSQISLINEKAEVLFDLNEQFPQVEGSGIRDIYLDSHKRLWIGGNFGVYILKVRPNNFSTHLMDFEDNGMNSSLSCRGIVKHGDNLFVNFETNGLCWKNQLSEDVQRVFFRKDNGIRWAMGSEVDQDGKIWIGSLGCMYKFDPATGDKKNIRLLGKKSTLMGWELFFDDTKRLWIGTQQGLLFMDSHNEIVEEFEGYNEFRALAKSHIIFINQNDKGNLLVCSNSGLYEIKPGKGVIARYWTEGEGEYYLPHDNYHHFYQDEDGVYWLSSGGAGLIRWEKHKGKFQQFGKSEGLSNEVIYATYPDNYGNLWLSSDYGIIRFNKESLTSLVFTPANGVSHHEFNRTSHFQDTDGKIYFGSLTGVTEIDPDKFQNGEFKANMPLCFTSFQQFDEKTNQLVDKRNQFLEEKVITIKPRDGFVRIEFALLNYQEMDRVNYAYKLEGVDRDWIFKKENFIRLSGLPYGRHLLKVKGQLPDGQWSEQELQIPVAVLKPFYLKWWFMAIVIIILATGGPYFYLRQTNHLKEQQIKLEVLVAERTRQINEDKKTIEQQAKELRHLDQVKSRFFANVSHELRTPLTLMLGPISSALKSGQLNEKNHRFLSTAQRSGKNLLHLVNEILDLSKMESGKLSLDEEPVDLESLLNRLFAQYESYAAQKGVEAVLKYQAASRLTLMIDINKFEKIFNNFMSNALKFTASGDKVEVELLDKGGVCWLRVADTGSGIHPDDLPNIFTRYYQSKQPNAPTQGGTGIGLALCTELARLQNGHVWAESDLGKGSVFTFEFPKKQFNGIQEEEKASVEVEEYVAEKAPAETVPLPNEGKKSTLLIVEDNIELRAYIEQVLNTHYKIETAENGAAALKLLNEQNGTRGIDLIVSDVMMPVMDGFEFLENLKSEHKYNGIPVIMLTARAALQDKLKALRIGVDDYMLKPFEEEELLARVKNLLDNHRERKKSREKEPIQEKEDKISGEDREWLMHLEDFTKKNAGRFDLSVEMIAEEMALSRSQLFRRMKVLTGLTPIQYVQEVRFAQARKLLEDKTYSTVKSVAYEVGFKQVKHFSTKFKKRYGKTPSEYLK